MKPIGSGGNYALVALGEDKTGHITDFSRSTAPFTLGNLTIYSEIRIAQAKIPITDTDNAKGLFA